MEFAIFPAIISFTYKEVKITEILRATLLARLDIPRLPPTSSAIPASPSKPYEDESQQKSQAYDSAEEYFVVPDTTSMPFRHPSTTIFENGFNVKLKVIGTLKTIA